MRTLEGHSDVVFSVAFSPDGSTLASGSWDNTIKLWDEASAKCTKTLAGHSVAVSSLAFSPTGPPWRQGQPTRPSSCGFKT